jgi:exopolysaccharide biosynthesis polyprenyl glycosylphosphotransferase
MLEPPDYAGNAADRSSQPVGRLLLVGGRRHMRGLARSWSLRPWVRLPIIGVVGPSGRGRQLVVHPASEPVPILGRLERLPELVSRSGATDLVVALEGRKARRLRTQIDRLTEAGSPLRVHWVGENGFALPAGAAPHTSSAAPAAPWGLRLQRVAKRLIDILGATLGLIALSPLLIGVALAILARTGWPIFYTQERVGQGGRRFRIIKYRSMRLDAEAQTGPIWAEDHDRRCTEIGEWLRHTNIDELPQLLNVLMGDMSLVGPRPERPCFVDHFQSEMPDYELRHAVPAGMTGWAQVHGWRGRTSLRKRLQYDLDYIGRWTVWLDLRILLMTVEHVLRGRTQWNEKKKAQAAPSSPS